MLSNNIFSRLIAIVLFILYAFVPCNPDGLALSVTADNGEEQVITAEWQNNTKKAIGIPRYFVEKNENGEWTEILFSDGFGFPDIASTYYPTEKGEITIISERVFGQRLPEGKYRITVYYDILNSDIKTGSSVLEFTL